MAETFDYSTSRYWYHVTKRNLGELVTLNPLDDTGNRGYDEPEIARICVAPTIPQCMVAIPLDSENFKYIKAPDECDEWYSKVYVYQTVRRKIAKKPFIPENRDEDYTCELPFDYKITNEGWLLRDTRFKLIGQVIADTNKKEVYNINYESCCSEGTTRATTLALKKISNSHEFFLLRNDEYKTKLIDFDYSIDEGVKVKKPKKAEFEACVAV